MVTLEDVKNNVKLYEPQSCISKWLIQHFKKLIKKMKFC